MAHEMVYQKYLELMGKYSNLAVSFFSPNSSVTLINDKKNGVTFCFKEEGAKLSVDKVYYKENVYAMGRGEVASRESIPSDFLPVFDDLLNGFSPKEVEAVKAEPVTDIQAENVNVEIEAEAVEEPKKPVCTVSLEGDNPFYPVIKEAFDNLSFEEDYTLSNQAEEREC